MTEILDEVEADGCPCEVIATGGAEYDESTSTLLLRLESSLRPLDTAHQPRRLSAPWLPGAETVRERVPFGGCRLVAKDIFEVWTRRVRRAIPALTPF